MNVLGYNVDVLGDYENAIIVKINGRKHTITKEPHFMSIDETRYIGVGDKEYYVGMIINDGVAESTDVEDDDGNGCSIKFKMAFPTLKEIFSDADKLACALSYSLDLGENPFDIDSRWDLYFLFEGFFFGGEYSKFYMDDGNGWKEIN